MDLNSFLLFLSSTACDRIDFCDTKRIFISSVLLAECTDRHHFNFLCVSRFHNIENGAFLAFHGFSSNFFTF